MALATVEVIASDEQAMRGFSSVTAHWERLPATAQDQAASVDLSSRPLLPEPSGFWTLSLGTLGVVYGDIGTSPLYALKESLAAAAGGGLVTREMVFGIVSLILWALIFIVTVKYVLFILRADNNGEGGTLTLMALAQRAMGHSIFGIALLGMVGAGPILRRRHDHPRDLGPFGHRRIEARGA